MSKIGNKVITIPTSVQVTTEQDVITVKGALGEMKIDFPSHKRLSFSIEGENMTVKRSGEDRKTKAMHGLYRSLIANAVAGVDKGWSKTLEVVGTGYNVKMQGTDLAFKVGYSHLVIFKPVAGLQFKVEGTNKVTVTGADRQLVGQVAYQIKMIKKPDAYKGKGVRYQGEVIKLKAGKKAKA